MGAGLFGKLPAKRDFISSGASRRFLEAFEPWLQSGLATSRQTLGAGWSDSFNRAPIWRFWLGADFCGEATIGALMPSVDGVGRSFPLTIFYGEGSASLPPPELEPNEAWCEAAETLLLDALEPNVDFEAFARRAEGMAPPALQPRMPELSGLVELPEGAVLVRETGRNIALAFRAARRFGHRRTFAAQSFWWTIGGEGFLPTALSCVGMPAATQFADLMTGAFGAEAPAEAADGG